MILRLWLRVSMLFINCSIRVLLVSSLLLTLAMQKSVNFIYLSVAPGVWCVLRVECVPSILPRLLDTICYKNVIRVPLSFDDYINRDYHYFARYQIGSLVFDLSSRDPLFTSKFFKQFFRDHFVAEANDL